MIPKQDRVYPRKPSDLEQKYNLGESRTGSSAKLSQLEQYVAEIKSQLYPIGSFYLSANDTNPAEIFGGTWESYTEGHLLIGLDTEADEPLEMLQISDKCYVWKRIS